MADPQDYTDAQLSDGTVLRFMGQLGPDEVRQKVTRYKATKAISANPPGVPRPDPGMHEVRLVGGSSANPDPYTPLAPRLARMPLDMANTAVDLSAPNVGYELYKQATGQPNRVNMGEGGLGQEALTNLLPMMAGDEVQPWPRAKPPLPEGVPPAEGGLLSKMARGATGQTATDFTGMLSPRLAHFQRLAGRLLGRMNEAPEAPPQPAPAPPAQPSYTGPTGPPAQWGSRIPPTPPGSATWQRPLPTPETGPSGAPTAAAARPSLSQQMEAAPPERRVSLAPYAGPDRRIAPEMRGFETAPPLDPERIGIDYRPAEDLGVKVRAQTEAAKGPINRGSKALSQSESLRRPATSNKLIQKMGGQPVETATGEREPYVPLGFREGPPKGTIVPQTSEEMQGALEQSLRRAKRGRILPND